MPEKFPRARPSGRRGRVMSDGIQLAVMAAGEGARAGGNWTRLGDDVVIGPAAARVAQRAARHTTQPMLVTQLGRLFATPPPTCPWCSTRAAISWSTSAGARSIPAARAPAARSRRCRSTRSSTSDVRVPSARPGRYEALVDLVDIEELRPRETHLATLERVTRSAPRSRSDRLGRRGLAHWATSPGSTRSRPGGDPARTWWPTRPGWGPNPAAGGRGGPPRLGERRRRRRTGSGCR